MKEILLNRMYVGTYLEDNIGHEVINLFKADNEKNYIYINPYGQLDKKHSDIESILLVRGINANTVEIIAKCEKPIPILNNALPRNTANALQRKYIYENRIEYDGVPLDKIFEDNYFKSKDDVVYISFEVSKVLYPKTKIYLTTDENCKLYGEKIFFSDINFPKQALHWTYDEDSNAYKIISDLLKKSGIWNLENETKKIIDIKTITFQNSDFNFLKLIRKEYDELCYSNMLQYFLSVDEKLYKKFISELLGLSPKGKYTIQREKEHIDLLIQDEENIIVIENKIKSGINGIRHDVYSDLVQSQLLDYHNYADKNANGRKESFFIFTPNYNHFDLSNLEKSEDYNIITYSQLSEFFEKNKIENKYFEDFLSAIKIHSKEIDNSNFEIMTERFIKAINAVK